MKISRQASTQIKGAAIIMMVFHHLFAYPSWWRTSFVPSFYSFIPLENITEIGECMKMCIPIYAFITGYGLSCTFVSKNLLEMYKWSFRKISFTLLNYWVILGMVETPIFVGGHQLVSAKGIISNLFGIGELIIPFAWYISFYVIVLLVSPLLICASRRLRGNLLLGYFGIGYIGFCYVAYYLISRWNLANIVLNPIVDYLLYSPYVVVGYVCEQVQLRKKVSLLSFLCTKNIFLCGLLLTSIGIKLALHGSTKFDIVIVPCFVLALADLLETQKYIHVAEFLSYMGRHSFNIWLFHCIPFIWILPANEIVQDAIYFPRSILLILIWTILLLLPLSYITDWIVDGVVDIFMQAYRGDKR